MRFRSLVQIVWLHGWSKPQASNCVQQQQCAPAVCNCRLDIATALPVWAWGSNVLFMAHGDWCDTPLR